MRIVPIFWIIDLVIALIWIYNIIQEPLEGAINAVGCASDYLDDTYGNVGSSYGNLDSSYSSGSLSSSSYSTSLDNSYSTSLDNSYSTNLDNSYSIDATTGQITCEEPAPNITWMIITGAVDLVINGYWFYIFHIYYTQFVKDQQLKMQAMGMPMGMKMWEPNRYSDAVIVLQKWKTSHQVNISKIEKFKNFHI